MPVSKMGANMKRVYVNEKWCLGCHLRGYNCAFANSGALAKKDGGEMFKGKGAGPLKRLFRRDGLLAGYILIGGIDRAGIYTSLIREKTPLDTVNFDILKKLPTPAAFSPENHRKKLGGAV